MKEQRYIRSWDGHDWQNYALKLVQIRHGTENVQSVPSKVGGDAGLEFFTADGILYQCYAPEETSDTSKAASAMKQKANRDLNKLEKNADKIEKLLGEIKVRRWILFTPFLDDKSVIQTIRKKGVQISNSNLTYLDEDFQAFVQSQEDFATEIGTLRLQSLGPKLAYSDPDKTQLDGMLNNEIDQRLTSKLKKAFPESDDVEINDKKFQIVRSTALQQNILYSLQRDHNILWENTISCIESEEARLGSFGLQSSVPNGQLHESLQKIEKRIRADIPSFKEADLSRIASGTVGDWLMRCPLDFK